MNQSLNNVCVSQYFSYAIFTYYTMIRHELNLLQDYRNIDKLNHRLEFKVIDAVSLYENYEEDEL